MAKLFILFFFGSLYINSNAQPVLDILNVKYSNSPDAGLIRRNNRPNHFNNFVINLNLPVIVAKDSSAFVFSPFVEVWNLRMAEVLFVPDQFQSLGLQASYIKPLSQKWTMTLSAIPRWNGYDGHWFDNNFQMGGAVVATYKKKATLKYKIGLYYNGEFSGAFFMPLLGIDWRINAKNNVFGVLPGNLVWEHKASKNIYYGCFFKALTNSYKAGSVNEKSFFMRIDDNQLGIYGDLYVTKKIVATLEAGHSILRQIRFGYRNAPEKYFYSTKVNDDLIIKAGIAYRLRLL